MVMENESEKGSGGSRARENLKKERTEIAVADRKEREVAVPVVGGKLRDNRTTPSLSLFFPLLSRFEFLTSFARRTVVSAQNYSQPRLCFFVADTTPPSVLFIALSTHPPSPFATLCHRHNLHTPALLLFLPPFSILISKIHPPFKQTKDPSFPFPLISFLFSLYLYI